MDELQYDDYLRLTYIESYPGDNEFEDITWNPTDEINKAMSVKEALDTFAATDKDLYFAFYCYVTQDAEPNDFMEWSLVDRKIILQLWDSGIEYSRIPRIMMYSPIHLTPDSINLCNKHTLQERWEMCASRVTAIINPILAQPVMTNAKMPCQLNLIGSDSREIYLTYLKNVLSNNPSMTLINADKKVVEKLFQTNYLSEETIYKCLENSFQFVRSADDIDEKDSFLSSSRLANKKKKFWADTLKEIQESEKKSEDIKSEKEKQENEYPNNDIQIWNEMVSKIEELNSVREETDIGKSIEFWQSAMDILRDTVYHMEHLKYQAQLLLLWNEILVRMLDNMKFDHIEDEKKITETLLEIIESNDSDAKNINRLCDILVKIDDFTESVLKLAFEKKDNQLLAVSNLQDAKPLSEVLSQKRPNAADVYFAFLRDVAESGVTDIAIADEKIITRLNGMFDSSLSESDRKREIAKCIRYSPAFSKLDGSERLQSASNIVNKVLEKEKSSDNTAISSR